MDFTIEQLTAIERRDGDLMVDASAGSGKTAVLVERFARAVVEDRVEVGAILTITFTDKAAAELRERIRGRLRELGDHAAARATECAFISTIHGFCARVLRAHALAAGIDPAFTVLDERQSEQLADAAFEDSLEDLGRNEAGGVELIAAYGAGSLRGAILATYAELRSRGELAPGLPMLPAAPDLEEARLALERAATLAAGELAALAEPPVRVREALGRLRRLEGVVEDCDPWPGELRRLSLPGGNGAALRTAACLAYDEALQRFRVGCEHSRAGRSRDLLDHLLRSFSSRYAHRKRERSALDFEDLELFTRELLLSGEELRERYAGRFARIMVDELQDTNQVQLELIESIARGNLFTVGDAQQSIYAFRHADVELFERRGQRLSESGARVTLQTNFRSRAEILEALNGAFTAATPPAGPGGRLAAGERFTPLRAGRGDLEPAAGPLVELLIADKGAQWCEDGLASPWRLAEARALAGRVGELIDGGAARQDVVVLTRASTDLRVYERALEQRGIGTYTIGGRGYWSHPQVLDLLAYLRALANPRDEQALYTVLASPLLGVSLDGMVLLAAAAREAGRDPWWTVREPEGRLGELDEQDREKLSAFADWFATERARVARASIEALIDRVLERTGYDLAMLATAGGERRLANVRKLMRLGREHEASRGRDLYGFLGSVRGRSGGFGGSGGPGGSGGSADAGEPRESEAPVEGEALDAVRLMTIHRAKGLEFEIVCVADLGRAPRRPADLLRVGRDGRLGLRLAQPGTGKREPALDYAALEEERRRAEELEERRLFYVAMTRARERLILSGAAKLDAWPSGAAGGPIAWIGPAFVPGIASRVGSERSGVSDAGVRFTIVRPGDVGDPGGADRVDGRGGGGERDRPGDVDARTHHVRDGAAVLTPPPAPEPAPPVSRLSYTSLGEYERCGYRFYAERVLGLPGAPGRRGPGAEPGPGAGDRLTRAERGPGAVGGLTGAERGTLAHALLERLDFRRPAVPSATAVIEAAPRAPTAREAGEIAELVARFAASELCARLGRATGALREQRFAFPLERGVLVTGALDVLAREPGGTTLVVDYKTDRLDGADPRAVAGTGYAGQRLIYALAGLRAGAATVEVVHAFLELPDQPVAASFAKADAPRLERELARLAAGVLRREFGVSDSPHRALCHGCPAEGGLCSWPLSATRRAAPDRLF